MDTVVSKSPVVLRWVVIAAFLIVCSILGALLVTAPTAPANLVHALALLISALVTYAWVLYPATLSVVISLAGLIDLTWAWAARRTAILGWEVAATGILLAAAGWQRARRMRRLLRMEQLLEDLQEELALKDQAIASATQAREALAKKLFRYTQLQTIAEQLSNMTDLVAIAQMAVDRTCDLIGKSDVGLLFLVDQERQELALFASRKRESIPSIRAKHGDQFDRYVLRTHRPLLVNDVRRDFRFTTTVAPEREVSSVIACPLLLGARPEGVLRLDSARPGVYTQDDLRFLDILLDLVATAITNAKLFAQTQQLAVTDSLTGLSLRRPFLEHLTRELTRAGRSREPVSVLMVDVDHFKRYNDAFGHTAGDVILKGVAEVLRATAPPGSAVARYGGEEFTVLLPRLSRYQAGELAEQIRLRVEQQLQGRARGPAGEDRSARRRAESDGAGRVTVSVGVASFPDDAQAELELIRVADSRLYQAKHAGRNLVISS